MRSGAQHHHLLPLPQLLPRPGPSLDLLLPPVLPSTQPAGPAHSHAFHQCGPAAADTEGQIPPTLPLYQLTPLTSPPPLYHSHASRGGGILSSTHPRGRDLTSQLFPGLQRYPK